SLFGETTLLVVDRAHELAAEQAAEVARLVRFPAEHVRLVLVHSGQANRAKAVLDACRDAHVVQIAAPRIAKIGERVDFVRAGGRAGPRAERARLGTALDRPGGVGAARCASERPRPGPGDAAVEGGRGAAAGQGLVGGRARGRGGGGGRGGRGGEGGVRRG